MDSASVNARAMSRERRKSRAIEAGTHSKTNRRNVANGLSISRSKRSNQEQIAQLDEKLGKGVGAKKERARLA